MGTASRKFLLLLPTAMLLFSCRPAVVPSSSDGAASVDSAATSIELLSSGVSDASSEESVEPIADPRFTPKGRAVNLTTALDALSTSLRNEIDRNVHSLLFDTADGFLFELRNNFTYTTPDSSELALTYDDSIVKYGGLEFNLHEGTSAYFSGSDCFRKVNEDPKMELRIGGGTNVYYKGASTEVEPYDAPSINTTYYYTDGNGYLDLSDEGMSGILHYLSGAVSDNLGENGVELSEKIDSLMGRKILIPPDDDDGEYTRTELSWLDGEGKTQYESSADGFLLELADGLDKISDHITAFSDFFDAHFDDGTYYVHTNFNSITKIKSFIQRATREANAKDAEGWENLDFGENPKLEIMVVFSEETIERLSVDTNLSIKLLQNKDSDTSIDIFLAIIRALFAAYDIEGYDITSYEVMVNVSGSFDMAHGYDSPHIPSSFEGYEIAFPEESEEGVGG